MGLPGEKPMMPPPPKVCPESPVLEPPKDDVVKEPVDDPEDEPENKLPLEELESVPPVLLLPLLLLLLLELSVELPGAPLVPLGLDGSLGLPVAPDPPDDELEASGWQPPSGEFEPMPMDELRPFEPMLEEPKLDEPMLDEPKLEEPRPEEPRPLLPQPMPPPPNVLAMGLPKKPKAVGCLFWPMWMGFHSSFPVEGSMYFLRRKRI